MQRLGLGGTQMLGRGPCPHTGMRTHTMLGRMPQMSSKRSGRAADAPHLGSNCRMPQFRPTSVLFVGPLAMLTNMRLTPQTQSC